MEKASQENSLLKISTSLGNDFLYVSEVMIDESLSSLFSVRAKVYTNGEVLSCDEILGSDATIYIDIGQGKTRCFNGQISNIASLGSRVTVVADGEKYQDYLITISPKLWLTTKRVNCRIFQKKNVEDIVKIILGEHGIQSAFELKNTHKDYEYKVQYQESDFDFISRLLESEGIYYFFEHSSSSHAMVFADSLTSYRQCVEANVVFTTGSRSDTHVSRWSGVLTIPSGKVTKSGFDFEKPKVKPVSSNTANAVVEHQAKLEVFEYQAESECNDRGFRASEIALSSLAKEQHVCHAVANCRSFTAGSTFIFDEHEDSREVGRQYLIISSQLEIKISNQTGAEKSDQQIIRNTVSCLPNSVLFTPSQTTQKPVIQGVQTAIVTGDAADEIHIDKFGRVKVCFHWDREGITDSGSSCWMRVAQNWAGDRWGAFFFPRKGQEVIVTFLNGDPDQPIINGAVYNGDLMPPYDLPADKTMSGIKTRSSKSGSGDNFNEIRFEDSKGRELLYLHAEKDHSLMVENDQFDDVGHNRYSTIANNDKTEISGERITEIGKSDSLKIAKELIIDAGKKITIKTGGASITLSSSGTVDIKGSKISINGSAIALKAGSIALN